MDSDKTVLGMMEAMKHIHRVRELLFLMIRELDDRARNHDQSKLESPEKEIFGEYTPELAKVEYGSDEYKALLEKVKPAIEHHYANNRHHVQYYENLEEWRDVKGFEDSYEVSNYGNVRSKTRAVKRNSYKKDNFLTKNGQILKQTLTPKGYRRLQLQKNGKHYHYLVHRLVAENFIPNPENKAFVNHINSNREDNNALNLEWVTPSENLIHAYDTGDKKSNVKYVVRNKEHDIVTIGTVKMAEKLKELGYTRVSNSGIWNCLNTDGKHLDLTFEFYPLKQVVQDSYINKMNLIDLLEMLIDWVAATERVKNGDIYKSIIINSKRFAIDTQLTKIFENTVREYF